MSVVTYAHHAQIGRVHWTPRQWRHLLRSEARRTRPTFSPMWRRPKMSAKRSQPTSRTRRAMLRSRPSSPNSAPARRSAARRRSRMGRSLKIGAQDDRVPLLRERLHVSGDGTTYDKALAEAVQKYQKEHEQKADRHADAGDGRSAQRPDARSTPVDTIIANLERWRWMPHELGKTYVMVNLPDFTLRVVQDGHQLWMTKIVDGKPNLPTPIMSAEMKYITVNPTWNVPPSIVAREYMPVLQQDSTALERMGLKVTTNPDGTVHIAQPPGERNALGRLPFQFPQQVPGVSARYAGETSVCL